LFGQPDGYRKPTRKGKSQRWTIVSFAEDGWDTAMTHSQTAAAEVNLFAIKTPCSLAKLWWDRKPSRWQFRLPIPR
jgi:hypothetical protein